MTERTLNIAGALPLASSLQGLDGLTLKGRYGHFIDGVDVPGTGETMTTVNPANGQVLAEVAIAGQGEIDAAVAAARKAFATWSQLPGLERGKYLYRIARRLQERSREFAILETLDNGKPIRETRDFDVPTAAAHFFYYAGWADKLDYAYPGAKARPLGVAAQVIPWNFPMLMLAWKIAPALACGNTVVLKPSETTPLTAALFTEVCAEVGLPKGVVNIVQGAGDTGARLVAHPGVDKVAFTGSTGVGRRILEAIAGTGKKSTMELGGKGAHIVYADADLDQAVEGVINGIFFNQGHVCCAGSRLLVEEGASERFLTLLKLRMQSLRMGDPLDKNTDVGAINSAKQLATVERYVEIGRGEGQVHQVCAGGPVEGGYWVPPTLITGVSQTDRVVREEIFGPVLSVLTFRTPAEAVKKANDSEYGLACGVWSEKTGKLFETAHSLNAGVVWANGYNLFDPTSPFGGIRHSGFGREGGIAGLAPYLTLEA